MATYLLIGPSGVGKTSASEILARKSDILVYDLDKILKDKIGGGSVSKLLSEKGNEYFFAFSRLAIEELERKSHSNIIIVVGAGSINFEASHEWYKKQNLISLIGDEAVLYERGNRKQHHPTLESYIATEFSPSRKNLYRQTELSINVTKITAEQVADRLINLIKNKA